MEVPMLVLVTDFIRGSHSDTAFSRCTSSLVVVCNEDFAVKIVPPGQLCDFAYTIKVEKGKITFLVLVTKLRKTRLNIDVNNFCTIHFLSKDIFHRTIYPA